MTVLIVMLKMLCFLFIILLSQRFVLYNYIQRSPNVLIHLASVEADFYQTPATRSTGSDIFGIYFKSHVR